MGGKPATLLGNYSLGDQRSDMLGSNGDVETFTGFIHIRDKRKPLPASLQCVFDLLCYCSRHLEFKCTQKPPFSSYLDDPFVITSAYPVTTVTLLLIPDYFDFTRAFDGRIVEQPFKSHCRSRSIQCIVFDRYSNSRFPYHRMKMNSSLCKVGG